MGEIILLNKKDADTLLSLGFKYTKRKIDGKEAYVFIQTKELMKKLNEKFGVSSFVVNRHVCF